MKQYVKSLISTCVVLVMLFALASPAFAADMLVSAAVPEKWDGSVAENFAGGSGSETDPFLISNASQLALIAKNVNELNVNYVGLHFKQTADINLDGAAWNPIGNAKSVPGFAGVYDGDNHIIYNMLCVPLDPADEADKLYNGLFGWISEGTVKNVKMMGGSVSTTKYAGGIAGYMVGGTIENCVSDMESIVGWYAAGIVGRAEKGTTNIIKGCVNHSTLSTIADKTTNNVFVGGIVGAAGNATISYCANYGDISGTNSTSLLTVGGICGIQGAGSAPASIYNCVDVGVASAIGLDAKNVGVGGICGRAGHVSYGEVIDCISAGKYTSDREDSVGGIAGQVPNGKAVIADNIYTTYEKIAGIDPDGYLDMGKVLKEEEMKGPDGIAAMKLGAGWVAEIDMIPYIDVTKLSAGEQGGEQGGEQTTESTTSATTPTTTLPTTTATEITTTSTTATETTGESTTATTTAAANNGGDTQTPGGDEANNSPVVLIVIIVVAVAAVGGVAAFLVIKKKK